MLTMDLPTRRTRGRGTSPAHIAGALLSAGAALAGIAVALPPAAQHSDTLVLVCGAIAAAAGIGLFVAKRPVPEWMLGAVVAFGTALITLATYEGGHDTGTSDNEMLYVWVAFYAFYFFALRHALLQLALVGGAYAALLTTEGVAFGDGVTRWIVTLGTLAVGGAIIYRLRSSLKRLVGELTDRARVDSLTGLLNRHALEERALVEFARSRREGRPVALLVCDVDDFKTINDTLGHPAGDQVLRRVAGVLSGETRQVDAVARVGGDEFALLLPGADALNATATASRLRLAIRHSAGAAPLRLTASVGVAVGPHEGDSLDELWQAADRAMYEAKRGGGDAVAEVDPLAPAAQAGAALVEP